MTTRRKLLIGVIGASRPSAEGLRLAEMVGREIARRGAVLVCGGLGGVMEAAAKGAVETGGEVIGILPGPDATQANPYVTFAVSTNMGHARNIIIAHTAGVLIAVEGEYGTLAEAAIALKLCKTVIVLSGGLQLNGTRIADTPVRAVALAIECLTT